VAFGRVGLCSACGLRFDLLSGRDVLGDVFDRRSLGQPPLQFTHRFCAGPLAGATVWGAPDEIRTASLVWSDLATAGAGAAGHRALGPAEPRKQSWRRIVEYGVTRSKSYRAPTLHRVSAKQVDSYLRDLEEPKRTTLQKLRCTILEIVPEAEEVISYRVPAFRLHGKTIAGFAAFKDHLSYLPFSGSVLGQLADDLDGYTMTKSSLHFSTDCSLPKELVKKLITVRLADEGLPSL
jgi:uncharacterized protein YdhG (YjbR/CyaY superfamily)